MSTMLEAELLAHLDAQLASARRLLALVLEQGGAIRSRDVDGVLGKLAEIQTEMGRRGRLEQERTTLLQDAGVLLGVPAPQVTLERLCALITAEAPWGIPPWWTIWTETVAPCPWSASEKAWTRSTKNGSRKKPVVAAPTPVGSNPGMTVLRRWVDRLATQATPSSRTRSSKYAMLRSASSSVP